MTRHIFWLVALAANVSCGGTDSDSDTDGTDTDIPVQDDSYDPSSYQSLCSVGELDAESANERAFRLNFIEALNAVRSDGGTCTRSDGSSGEFGSVGLVALDPDLTAIMDCFLEQPAEQWADTDLFEETAAGMGMRMSAGYAYTALSNHGSVDTDPADIMAAIQASSADYALCEDVVFGYNNRRGGVAFEGNFIYWLSAR